VKLTEDDVDVARTLLADLGNTVADVADRIGVSLATLYRNLPTTTLRSPARAGEGLMQRKIWRERVIIML
jgi:Helix-turn-helix domain of resolvase